MQKFTFYEIDPLVEKIARDEKLFTYLRDCSPKLEVIIGDARISLAKAPNRHYDLFVLDAFSSDVIPTHLLTREALELYLQKVSHDGLVFGAYLQSIYGPRAGARSSGAEFEIRRLHAERLSCQQEESKAGKYFSRWVILARMKMPRALSCRPTLATVEWSIGR